jgi:hypothetical protein
VGTVGQEPASGDKHASMFSGIGYYLAVALILTLVFLFARTLFRNFLLNPYGGEKGVERDDA